ncbi:AraC family transcriptional regulator [Anaerococcus porci]|uniref:helix-turn-helix domain-containing protein n=1 Tax=Anaerococcus porci TaxID=2652269 RepID=UPI002A75978C|nr:AraC family transcriptional regulator [Anaerococcus porci]MDY3006716.1 AraC family transcriptional regulator [Anaerococcus porci]
MTYNRLKSWGFREIKTDNPKIINYEGLENKENKMTSYEIFPGVFIMYINLKKKYQAKASNSPGNTGFRIGFCAEGNYFTYINYAKILITTNEIFLGKAIPKSKMSYTSSHNTRAFNIIIVDKKIEKKDFSYPFIKSFLDSIKNIKDIGRVIDDKTLVSLAKELVQVLESCDFNLISLKSLELIYRISLLNSNSFKDTYYQSDSFFYIEKIEAYMRENLEKNISLDYICEKFKISKSSLTHKFMGKYQYTPMKYLSKLRLIRAEDLLINTDKSITEISLEVSFTNTSNFTRAFKAFTGRSPSEYRKKNKI